MGVRLQIERVFKWRFKQCGFAFPREPGAGYVCNVDCEFIDRESRLKLL